MINIRERNCHVSVLITHHYTSALRRLSRNTYCTLTVPAVVVAHDSKININEIRCIHLYTYKVNINGLYVHCMYERCGEGEINGVIISSKLSETLVTTLDEML